MEFPSHRFLWRVARTRLREADADGMRNFVNEGPDWNRLVEISEEQGVAGLFLHHLQNEKLTGAIPPEPMRQLEKLYLETATKTLAICALAEEAAELLRESGIPFIALQGLSVVGLYGDPGLRPMADADLLIQPGDKTGCREILLNAGYSMYDPLFPDLFSRNGVGLDLHTHILNLDRIASRGYLFPEDLTSMWDRAIPGSGTQGALMRLDPLDRVIALAAHAMKHGYSRLIWLADLHESLRDIAEAPEGWKLLAERSRYWKQQRVIGYALVLLQRMFELEIPPWLRAELGIQHLSWLEERLLETVVRGFCPRELPLLLALCNIPAAGDKFRFLRESLFPKAEVMQQLFPDSSGKRRPSAYLKRIVDSCLSLLETLRRLI